MTDTAPSIAHNNNSNNNAIEKTGTTTSNDEDPVITMMEDDAYLMSIVDTDSLLPSNMTFGGMFEAAAGGGENTAHQQLNAEELTGTSTKTMDATLLALFLVAFC